MWPVYTCTCSNYLQRFQYFYTHVQQILPPHAADTDIDNPGMRTHNDTDTDIDTPGMHEDTPLN
jgi:hypothetical protein